MFERYTEKSRVAIFRAREEAAEMGSPFIESEHLLLGIIRSCEAEIEAVFHLKLLEAPLRTTLAASPRTEPPHTRRDQPLSNECKRILAYSAEEAERLGSWVIHSGHLLLGILREHESGAAGFLSSNSIDLPTARRLLGDLTPRDAKQSRRPRTQWAMTARHSYRVVTALGAIALVLLAIGISVSAVSGLPLLILAVAWFIAVFATRQRPFYLSFGGASRASSIVSAYVFFLFYQLFIFGWIIPLAVGIYRVAARK